jgi:ATP-dependent Clp protease ATP-binding subunit ClpA
VDFASLLSLVHLAFPGFTDRALKALSAAREQAAVRHHQQVAPEHLLLALAVIEPGPGRVTLDRLGVDLRQSVAQLEALLPAPGAGKADDPPLSLEMEQLLAEAKAESAWLK